MRRRRQAIHADAVRLRRAAAHVVRCGRQAVGFSLVEMMIALGLGLLLVGLCSGVLLGQIDAQRRMVIDTRLSQELRTASELMARDLRRAGHWADAPEGLWPTNSGQVPLSNPHAPMRPLQGDDVTLAYSYDRHPGDPGTQGNERFGWRINANTNALEFRQSGPTLAPGTGDAWQAVTDPAQTRMRSLSVHVERQWIDTSPRCASSACPAGTTQCQLPQVAIRIATVTLEAAAVAEPSLVRHTRHTVRLRGDLGDGQCPSS